MSAPDPFDPMQPRINPTDKIGPKNVSVPPPIRSGTGSLRAQPDDASFETDFADLAARFAAKSGGGLSPELSADLALEIVLNEIVEQACLATGATGAAIVVRRDNDMICRATSGPLSPDLGSRLDVSGGLSGECVRTLRTVRCDDALADKRADVEASKRLGVRSVVVMPLLRGTELVGAFELFSSRVGAFGDRDERTLEALASRTLKSLARAAQAIVPANESLASSGTQGASVSNATKSAADAATSSAVSSKAATVAAPQKDDSERKSWDQESAIRNLVLAANREVPVEESKREESLGKDKDMTGGGPPGGTWWRHDFTTLALTAAVLVCALLLAVVVAKHFQIRQKVARAHTTSKVATAKAPEAAPTQSASTAANETTRTSSTPLTSGARQADGITIRPASRSDASSVPAGELRIYDNGKEIFRATPPPMAPDKDRNMVRQAAAIEPEQVVQLSPETAEESLLNRVEPEYPEQARTQNIQGAVVLDVHIGADGVVQDEQVVSGDPLLAQASTNAVRQWRFKPHAPPAQMQTRITLNFRLPR